MPVQAQTSEISHTYYGFLAIDKQNPLNEGLYRCKFNQFYTKPFTTIHSKLGFRYIPNKKRYGQF